MIYIYYVSKYIIKRVGRIVEAWKHPDSDKLYCEKIDCGEGTIR